MPPSPAGADDDDFFDQASSCAFCMCWATWAEKRTALLSSGA
jgi:hypothetical protein